MAPSLKLGRKKARLFVLIVAVEITEGILLFLILLRSGYIKSGSLVSGLPAWTGALIMVHISPEAFQPGI